MYTCQASAVTAIRELGVGWKLMPYDEPERGLRGIYAFKEKAERAFQWPLYGRELVPNVELCSGEDLLAFVQTEPAEGLFPSDDARGRLIGFVSYRRAPEGRAEVRRTTLTNLKSMPTVPRELLLSLRGVELQSSNRSAAIVHTIKPYGRLRVWAMRIVRKFFPLR